MFPVSDIFHSIALLPYVGELHETRSCFNHVRNGPLKAGHFCRRHIITVSRVHGFAAGFNAAGSGGGTRTFAVGVSNSNAIANADFFGTEPGGDIRRGHTWVGPGSARPE